MQDHEGQGFSVLLRERGGLERRSEAALQGEAVAGAAILAHQVEKLGAPRRRRLRAGSRGAGKQGETGHAKHVPSMPSAPGADLT